MGDAQNLERRVAKLERTNRVLLGALVLAGVGALFAAQDEPDAALDPLVRTTAVEIVDPATGAVAMDLTTDGGTGAITIYDIATQRPLALFSTDADGGVVQLNHRESEGRAYVGTDAEGGLVLVRNAGGDASVVLGVIAEHGLVALGCPDDLPRLTLRAGDRSGELYLHDAEGRRTHVLRVHEDGTSGVRPVQDE